MFSFGYFGPALLSLSSMVLTLVISVLGQAWSVVLAGFGVLSSLVGGLLTYRLNLLHSPTLFVFGLVVLFRLWSSSFSALIASGFGLFIS